MHTYPLNRKLFYPLIVVVIVGLFLLSACTPLSTTPTPALTPTTMAVVETGILTALATPTIAVTPTFLPTDIPEPTLASLMPGWIWYQSPNGVYTVAYPQQWQTLESGGAGIFIFSSPETNSQIRISTYSVSGKSGTDDGTSRLPDAPSVTVTPSPPACSFSDGTDWLDTVRANRSSFPGIPVAMGLAFNATFGDQPAFFHFSPPPGGGGSFSAVLLFCDAGSIVSLYYQSATDVLLPAEAAIYQQMVASFTWRGHAASPLEMPTSWMTGEALAIRWPQLKPIPLSAEEMLLYHEGFVATVTELDPGIFEVTTDDGQTIRLRSPSYFFNSGLVPGQEDIPTMAPLEVGERVFLVGRPVISPTGERFLSGQYLAVERSGQRQTVGFQTTFDLAYESLNPELLKRYPQDEPIRVRLLGTWEQIAPYLVDEVGSLLADTVLTEIQAAQQVIIHGILLTPDNPRLQLEELFILKGDCQEIADYELDCYPWQRLYPPVPPIEITAVVSEVNVNAGVVVLEQPVNGFIAISLAADGHLLTENGAVVSWETIQSGQQINAAGQVGPAGTFLAQEIHVPGRNNS